MLKRKLLIISFLFLFVFTTGAQDKALLIEELAGKYFEYGLFNGVILAAENGNIVYQKGFGSANKEKNIPNSPDTKFRLASVTKQFTAMLIMQLVEQGKLKLEDKLSDILPYYRKDTGGKITIHNLLNHTSGIPNYTDAVGYMSGEEITKTYNEKDFILKFGSEDLQFEPGTQWNYSNTGYYILGAIIQEVTGKTYAEALKENILEPLGMNNTGVERGTMSIENYSTGYNMTPIGLMPARQIEMSNAGAAGAMYSTIGDMLKWDRALYTNKLVSEETMKKIFTPYLGNYGYGWMVIDAPLPDRTTKVVLHTGGVFGYSTVIMRSVEDDKTVIVLNNITNARTTPLANNIAKILYGLKPDMPKQPLVNILVKTQNEKGTDEAIRQFNELRIDSLNYAYSEDEINMVGYMLLTEDKTDDALKIFTLNTELFPKAFNTWDSLAEAWLKKGDKDKAIMYYKRSIELNPDNQNAKDVLKKLESKN